jgi:glycosyltransferase involved in cell wall biosynthesis
MPAIPAPCASSVATTQFPSQNKPSASTFSTPSHSKALQKKIQEAYQSSDLFVFPSLYDPFANVVLESLACGLPALTTTTNGSSEIITQDTDRYVMKGATDHLAKDLADRIQEFCKLSPDERSMMRKAAIERATAMSDGESLFTSIKSPNLDAEKS